MNQSNSQDNPTPDTRQRVLAAAGEVFADKGYEKATIRDIVDRANANLNSVNYYFRDKHGLYTAVFEQAHQSVTGRDQEVFAQHRLLPPDRRLRAMILHILHGFISAKRATWQSRLFFREMTEPTGVLDAMIQRFIRPRFEELIAILHENSKIELPDLDARLCAQSIVAQCGHVAHHRVILKQLIPELEYTEQGLEAIADHIFRFSLAAIQNIDIPERNQ